MTGTLLPLHWSTHWPALQKEGVEQALPQVPQFPLSVLVSTQIPLQSVEPVGQVAAQLPLLHAGLVAGHTLPQLPQLLESTSVLTHVPSQLSVVEADVQQTLAAPLPVESALELSPLGQTPHAPPQPTVMANVWYE